MSSQHYQLSGLHCQRCVAKVTEQLKKIAGVIECHVDKQQATLVGTAKPEQVISAIESLGYHAVRSSQPSLTAAKTPLVEHASSTPSAPTDYHYQLTIEGMTCASCVYRVEQALSKVPGSREVQVSLAEQRAWIKGTPSIAALIAAVEHQGYHARLVTDEAESQKQQQRQQQQQLIRLAWQSGLALLAASGLMIYEMAFAPPLATPSQPLWLLIALFSLIIMFISGKHFYLAAWKNLRICSSTMDTLITLGTLSAFGYSVAVTVSPQSFPDNARHLYYEAGLMIIGLINLGRYIELRVKQRTSNALQKLLSLAPDTAKVIDEKGQIQLVAQKELQIGMRILLATGDRVPIDGNLVQGDIWLNSAMLTGENRPVHKQTGEPVWAGTLVENGSAHLQVTCTGEQTQLARIVALVQQAQNSQPAISQWINKIASIFVPCVIIIALFSGLLWFMWGPEPHSRYFLIVTTSVLIIACPCALGLAIPMSIIAGVGRAAELGILIRDANALQSASSVDTLIFDKTGTLTQGSPQVTQFMPLVNTSTEQLLLWSMALEQTTYHPLGQAIVDYAKQQLSADIALPAVSHSQLYPGMGISGEINGVAVLLGDSRLLSQKNIVLTTLTQALPNWQQNSSSLVLLAIDQQLAAIFIIEDRLRSDSSDTIKQLQQQGYAVSLLSGDHLAAVQQLAEQVNLTDYHALCLPQDKVNFIAQKQKQGHCVAMVGDGINDAPALAQANVSISLHGGSDIAMETAAITLLQNKLSLVVTSLQLTKAIRRNMQQNLLAAFIYNILSIPLAAGLLYPFTGMLLNPMVASAAMALSSVSVVLNASRLRYFNLR